MGCERLFFGDFCGKRAESGVDWAWRFNGLLIRECLDVGYGLLVVVMLLWEEPEPFDFVFAGG